ncbi:hypothetical protein C3489_00525 [Streptomyces sp. Ru71]|uniref:hypothetical protein n=1 Tax=Streptomyces sp. Ru71 TaxID=2080746 RepID=UPI000CDDC315|nr:hypothetical protein [Streptomyces sp. Ru71]POX57241.1 hypothetical protein C3489_00525 [Streptomyces sp. Ru71]
MGDYYERIVDVEVGGEEAGPLAERMVDWMVREGLITRETSAEGVYSLYADEGYLPGPNWPRAVADASDPDWLPGPVAVVVGRHHHVGGQGADEAEYADCPRCGTRTVFIDYPERFEADEEVWGPFREAIAAWEEQGEGSAPCPACGASVPVTEWRWESGFAVGALAFDFWGWPPLAAGFVAEFGRRLGHRTVDHMGKF